MLELIIPAALAFLGISMIGFCDFLRRRGGDGDFLFHFRIAGIGTLGAGWLVSMATSEKGLLPYFLFPLGIALIPCGAYLLVNSFKNLRERIFFGPNELVVSGVYQLTRHPIYLGALLVLVGGIFITRAPSVAICVGIALLYFLPAIRKEEEELYQSFGEQYLKYKQSVPMLIPVPGKKLRKGDL